MDKNNPYYKQVQLLMQMLPFVATESCFALKGGTAINLFVRDFPRLSVDIDLVYLPNHQRNEALVQIKMALQRIAATASQNIHGLQIHPAFLDNPDSLRLIITKAGVRIKIELSPVLRGTVYDPVLMETSPLAEDAFGYVEMPVVSLADLYAGKICAALDRQHPRDLFDIKILLENEGLTTPLRKASLVYIISHSRPISELLEPNKKDISALYDSEFATMTDLPIELDELITAREQLIQQLNADLTDDEKRFLMSFKLNQPDWSLLGLEGVDLLPAVRWKQQNLARMSETKLKQSANKLADVLKL
jgi:predicted nucleotidyltransferase component of viral defense system